MTITLRQAVLMVSGGALLVTLSILLLLRDRINGVETVGFVATGQEEAVQVTISEAFRLASEEVGFAVRNPGASFGGLALEALRVNGPPPDAVWQPRGENFPASVTLIYGRAGSEESLHVSQVRQRSAVQFVRGAKPIELRRLDNGEVAEWYQWTPAGPFLLSWTADDIAWVLMHWEPDSPDRDASLDLFSRIVSELK